MVDADSYAIAFVKTVDGLNPKAIVEWVRWCCQAGGLREA
jgi:hypothetical protein